MSNSNYFKLKEVMLNNNCPECYSNSGLKLTFNQKTINNLIFSANSQEVTYDIYCENCNTKIFPINWNKDIEMGIAYQKRALQTKPRSFKLTTFGFVILALDLIIVAMIVLYTLDIIKF